VEAVVNLDRRVQFYRATYSDDGFGQVQTFAPYGGTQPARRRDVSDGEKFRANEVQSMLMTRFLVRYSAFTAGLVAQDKLTCEGLSFDIVGIKQTDNRRQFIEITAVARTDALPVTPDFSEAFSEEFS
jgi:head-tail adaptor